MIILCRRRNSEGYLLYSNRPLQQDPMKKISKIIILLRKIDLFQPMNCTDRNTIAMGTKEGKYNYINAISMFIGIYILESDFLNYIIIRITKNSRD